MTTHSSFLAWKIPWTEEPGVLQSIVCQESDMTEQLNCHHHKQFTSQRMKTHSLSSQPMPLIWYVADVNLNQDLFAFSSILFYHRYFGGLPRWYHLPRTSLSVQVMQETWVPGFNPWVGKSPGGGNATSLWHSCLENSLDRGACP